MSGCPKPPRPKEQGALRRRRRRRLRVLEMSSLSEGELNREIADTKSFLAQLAKITSRHPHRETEQLPRELEPIKEDGDGPAERGWEHPWDQRAPEKANRQARHAGAARAQGLGRGQVGIVVAKKRTRPCPPQGTTKRRQASCTRPSRDVRGQALEGAALEARQHVQERRPLPRARRVQRMLIACVARLQPRPPDASATAHLEAMITTR